ncbi:complement C1q tumor necrosis factor-related protein 3-like isoform 2-T2 [Odontesthes bonariensis]|uniref:complement C1q tumor necrosis factor-related protein 3-like isoform X2 n=1 Tax=Odontesthes bonariensis TaxID=219752 RepID=UPI003F5883CC
MRAEVEDELEVEENRQDHQQRGDEDLNEWMKEKEKLMKNLEDKLKIVECQSKTEALGTRLNTTVDELTRQKAEMEKLKKENEGLKTKLDASEKEIDKLKENSYKTAPQIAFSASLVSSGEMYKGPCADKTLIFKRVFSNIGNAYNLNTGIFTAPVNGLYYFTFSTYGYNTHTMGAILIKNTVRQISVYDSPSADGSDSSSNAAVLQLAASDKVHVELWDNGRVFDDLNGHTTFSGFLLFSL